MGPLLLVFFCSGAAGLIYQVVWVRQLESCFGSSVYAVALVTAIFMLGLGVGSLVAGRYADRRSVHAPAWGLRAYGAVELAIGALGVTLAYALPHLADVVAGLSSYAVGEHGWLRLSASAWALRGLLALVCLAPVTLLMGATLTLLIRALVVEDTSVAGPRIGWLYAANTLGAAAGSVATDAALVPALGLVATQGCAAALNLIAAAWALGRARRAADGVFVPDRAPPRGALDGPTETPPRAVAPASVFGIAAAMALTGFASMAMQIVWYRQLSAVLRAQRNVFSTLLAVLLAAYAAGAVAGGLVARRPRWVRPAYALCMSAFVITALVGLATLVKVDPEASGAQSELWFILGPIAHAVLLPSFFVGATFPLANAAVQAVRGEVGQRAGALYLGNTLGAVAGALVGGLVLLPGVGVLRSAAVAALVALLAAVAASRARVAWPALAGAAVVSLWFATLPPERLVLQSIPARWRDLPMLSVREGVNETLIVAEGPALDRRLITNGHSMSGTAHIFQRYMRLFSHLPLLMVEAPTRALVICFGAGNTAGATLLHPLERLDLVDLSEDVLEQAPLFRGTSGEVVGDPRVQVHVNDGKQHLRMVPPAHYDLITAEPPPLSHAGVAGLYSREFYALARSRLKPGGVMTQWLPLYQVPRPVALSAVRAFLEVFPDAALLSGTWNELILIGRHGPALDLDPEAWRMRLAALPAVQQDLDAVFAGTITELLGTFVASAEHLRTVTQATPPLTDDWPIMEYGSLVLGAERRLPGELFAPTTLPAACPRCYEGGVLRAELAPLGVYLAIWGALYADEAFLGYPMGSLEARRAAVTRAGLPWAEVQAVMAVSPYLRYYLGSAAEVLSAARARLEAGDGAGAEAELRDAARLWPLAADVRAALAERLEATGRSDEARALRERARALSGAPRP